MRFQKASRGEFETSRDSVQEAKQINRKDKECDLYFQWRGWQKFKYKGMEENRG